MAHPMAPAPMMITSAFLAAISILHLQAFYGGYLVTDINLSISSAEGIEVCAPLTVTESAAAADALRSDSFTDILNDSVPYWKPQKESPAPTVSTGSTGNAA